MAILKIARMGHPVLLARAAEVGDLTTPVLARLLADMADTLADSGGVGLAAPQVFVSQRVFLFHVPASRSDTGVALPRRAVINPVVEPLSGEKVLGWEGCLSLPGLRAAVPRFTHIRLTGFTPDGSRVDEELTGFAARVAQHETDHLDGILYPMRMEDFRYFGYNEELERNPAPLPEI
ncbi:peptide deformylase [Acidocella aromatica]|uniref:Peptide deformylase n=1 Tax=Acidocella aromatica TaxID=1303579 RepID=A0A840VEK1_9PROT|nr:peptide deformylase [Acidocella aromatica]MBB5374174.1 peptide deformylase [Acidocella aromatica]